MKLTIPSRFRVLYALALIQVIVAAGIGWSLRHQIETTWEQSRQITVLDQSKRQPFGVLSLIQPNIVVHAATPTEAALQLESNGEQAKSIDITISHPTSLNVTQVAFPSPYCQPASHPVIASGSFSFSCLNTTDKSLPPSEILATFTYQATENGLQTFQSDPRASLLTDNQDKNILQKSLPLSITVVP